MASLPVWRHWLVPVVALILPVWWMGLGGDIQRGVAAAILGVGISAVGAAMALAIHGRPMREVHARSVAAWSVVVAGATAPILLLTGWWPNPRPLVRPNMPMPLDTMPARVAMAGGTVLVLALIMWILNHPSRGGGWTQRWLARTWGSGLCDHCGMARFGTGACHHCGADTPA